MTLGITGRAGSGKSTAAEYLVENHRFTRVKFADPLKDMIRGLYRAAGYDEETIERKIEGDLKEVPCELLMGRTPRHAMQTLGGDWGRGMIHPHFWVNQWKARRAQVAGLVVADDVRYNNEAEAIWGQGGVVALVERDGSTLGEGEEAAHASEDGISPRHVGVLIDNGGPEADLYEQLSKTVYVHFYGGDAGD